MRDSGREGLEKAINLDLGGVSTDGYSGGAYGFRIHATHRERLAEVLATLSTDELAQVVQAMTTLELAATRQAGVTPRTGTDC